LLASHANKTYEAVSLPRSQYGPHPVVADPINFTSNTDTANIP